MSTETIDRLQERIAKALSGNLRSSEIAAIVTTVAHQLEACSEKLRECERICLDPVAAPDVVHKARAEVAELTFDQRRLSSTHEKLQISLIQGQEREEAKQKADKVKRVRRESEALAEDIRRLYPDAAETIRQLCERVKANRRAVSMVNSSLKDDPEHQIETAEFLARGRVRGGYDNWFENFVRLPSIEDGMEMSPLWPPFERMFVRG